MRRRTEEREKRGRTGGGEERGEGRERGQEETRGEREERE